MEQRLRDVWRRLPRRIRRMLAAGLGGSVVVIGVVMLVTPGPAVVVIPLGLSILAAEFAWARYWIRRLVPEAWHPEFVREPVTPEVQADPPSG